MSSGSDPNIHRQREKDFISHVERLLHDDRLRLDTLRGRRPITGMKVAVGKSDRAVDLKRLMSEMRRPDRDLQAQMPIGESLEATLSQRRLLVLKKTVGVLRVVCISPSRALLAGEEIKPLKPAEVQKILGEIPPPLNSVPQTIVLMSSSGFTLEAHELAERRADRTVVMAEPNAAGGWAVFGPVETKSLVDLFDPEADDSKRARVRDEIEQSRGELGGSGVASDKLAAKTQLPLQLVESELKSFAKASPGLVAKRLDGRVVLFREGHVPPGAVSASGGGEMPLMDRIKTLFARKGETEKKVAFLSERRTALSQQRDRAYEELGGMEKRESSLRDEFKTTGGELTKRRITGQLLQLRKEIERRQQLMSVLNQQINVVSTHLHNLELVQQGQQAKLPDSEEVAADAAKAEEMLAGLQAVNDLAGSVGGIVGSGLSDEEKALYDELEKENADAASQATSNTAQSSASVGTSPAAAEPTRAAPQRKPMQPEAG